ncbi:penicillin acylase family protein [Acidisphaera sp. L21]|uniref:penicillin acylase family protein n=1 Tax=Acidisphaera sp. L21 TaxID=1641851 RepID=UPI00131C4209|nr:penicillin acylase family protein [Acidisphaera sp. L21]
MPQTSAYTVPGLEQGAEIRVDRWGIPHLRASSRRDVFFVQGLNAARDRLWQLDIWRKRGLGRMAADFGPGFLAQDRAARLFLYRGDMDAEWAAYGTSEARATTEAFVAGINAWIGLTEADPSLLPPEFAAMDTRPERWEASDVVRIRSHGLVRNVLSEAARAQIVARAGFETDLVRRSLEPAHTATIPEGLDPACVPPDVLDVFKLATAAPDFSPERLGATLEDAWRWTKVTDTGDVYLQGSNNWTISGSRSATGRPILASDPHRAHALPSLRSIVHLTAPGIDVIGAGEPALPGIAIGHNGHAAFSLTIFPMDQEDLFVYALNPANPAQYRYGDGWEAMTDVTETIAVRGCADQTVQLAYTRHGPVVKAGAGAAFAVRTVWSQPGSSAYFGSLAYLGVRSVEEFGAALSHWSTPSVNQVYADATGHIAWFAAGRSPVRPNWDGLMPVPGDGRYEWDGFHAFDALPRSIDPARGYFATANEMNLPGGFPADDLKLGFEWAERSRSNRIHQLLDAQPQHSLAESMALQTDDYSVPGQRLGRLIAGFSSPAAALLQAWDHHLARDSAAAALQEVWWSKHLKPTLLDRASQDTTVRNLLVPGDVETLLGLLEAGFDGHEDLLSRTLDAAWADCAARMGSDPAGWAWGRLHHGAFPHPLARVADLPGVGRLPKGGSASTPMAAGYRMSDFKVTHGASFRMVVDVGNWDASQAINAPGQSGDPRSPHFADLAPLWAAGEYVPLLYTAAAVDAATEHTITLHPANA